MYPLVVMISEPVTQLALILFMGSGPKPFTLAHKRLNLAPSQDLSAPVPCPLGGQARRACETARTRGRWRNRVDGSLLLCSFTVKEQGRNTLNVI